MGIDIKIGKKQKISEMIVDVLIEKIRKGELKVGEQLPNERALAESLGVSRMPLREAIHALAQAGVLETRHGQGTFVSTYDSEKLGRTLYWHSLIDSTTLIELAETRKILEVEAAKIACRIGTDEEIEEIRQAMIEREELIALNTTDSESLERRFDADRRFHEAICRASHNSIFSRFLSAIQMSLRMQQKATLMVQKIPSDTSKLHRDIYEAIRSRNVDEAGRTMGIHLDRVIEAVHKVQH